MNKTIEILAEQCTLPSGTRLKLGVINNGEWFKLGNDEEYGVATPVQVDFSELPPLYPTKGMEVLKGGIPFSDSDGKLMDCAENYFYYKGSSIKLDYQMYVHLYIIRAPARQPSYLQK